MDCFDASLLSTAKHDRRQIKFNFDEFDEAAKSKAAVTHKVEEAAKREQASRSIFAQNAIKAEEIETDLKEVDEAIGDPRAVETFVVAALTDILGVQVILDEAGARMSWDDFVRAVVFLGRSETILPSLTGDLLTEVNAWRQRGVQPFSLKSVIPAVSELGSKNLHLETSATGHELSLRSQQTSDWLICEPLDASKPETRLLRIDY